MQKHRLFIGAVLVGLLLLLALPNPPVRLVGAQPITPTIPRPTLPPLPTAGPPRPTIAPSATPTEVPRAPGPPADVCVRLRAEPASAIPPGEVVNYQLVAQNLGSGRARQLDIRLQFTAGEQSVLDATFSDPVAWVRELRPDTVVIALDTLHAGSSLTATVRLRTNTDAPLDQLLSARAEATWSNVAGGGSRRSNYARLLVARSAASEPPMLQISPPSESTTSFTVSYDGFAANERVSRWYTGPDGQATALDTLYANAEGGLIFHLDPSRLPSGRITLVAYGECSRVEVVGSILVIM